MPANLSPDYKKAEQAYRAAADERERLECLKEMLRTIPKHKGTEHLQADIKSRIKTLTEELSGPRKGGKRTGPVHSIRPEGAAQIALLGPPNAGKSSLHARLTGSRAQIAPYPHTTHEPMAGMCPFEDIHLQLVDLPALSSDFVAPWLQTALQPADAALLVVDLADPAAPELIGFVCERLAEKKITLIPDWPGSPSPGRAGAVVQRGGTAAAGRRAAADAVPAVTAAAAATATAAATAAAGNGDDSAALAESAAAPVEDPFAIRLPTLLLANKAEFAAGAEDLTALLELADVKLPALAVSAETGAGIAQIAPFLFAGLGILRVYTKLPGKPPERDKPFTVRQGATVLDVANLVHRDLAGRLAYARAWGRLVYDGQQVGPEHAVADGDIVELHMR
jgi:ribosome-interacting GTPase 1